MLRLTSGNLLEADAEALVNTVNTHGVMGKGIALQFKKAFPDNFEAYAKACEKGEVRPGHVFLFERSVLNGPRYIFNFPTKRHWRDRARLDDLASGLNDLVSKVEALGIRSIAVPPLGCGHGGLSWKTVYPMIEEAFAELGKTVDVRVYEPAGAPEPEAMVDRTSRPRMTAGRAALLMLMHRYLQTGWEYKLTLLELQKLAYFLQESGEPMKLRFKPLIYGPYADELRHALNRMEGHFVHGFGDGGSAPTTKLELVAEAVDDAERFIEDRQQLHERLDRVSRLIENFESPFGMELLSSVHWLAAYGLGPDTAASAKQAAALLAQWNTRKARTFREDHVSAAWARLADEGWLAKPQRKRAN